MNKPNTLKVDTYLDTINLLVDEFNHFAKFGIFRFEYRENYKEVIKIQLSYQDNRWSQPVLNILLQQYTFPNETYSDEAFIQFTKNFLVELVRYLLLCKETKGLVNNNGEVLNIIPIQKLILEGYEKY